MVGVAALPLAAWAQSAPAIAPNTIPVLRPNGTLLGATVISNVNAGRLTVNQSDARAIIDWSRFNIGSNASVVFNQPNSAASALNRIFDLNPSVILGNLQANGQVLLINQNGILFGRGAQVNTQSLVASTLNITNERFRSGSLAGGGLTTPAFAGAYDENGETIPNSTPRGTIEIGTTGTGAVPRIEAGRGGSVVLVAPSINNQNGIISAPDGQVILAAGAKAYLALNDSETDTTLRGYVVEVEAARDGDGVNLTSLVRNAGVISADRGNVTLAALAVNQEGRVSATTALQSNGSVYLKAGARVRDAQTGAESVRSGTVNLTAGSVTEVAPDTADSATVPESVDFATRRGVIQVEGRTIASAGTIRAAGGRINLIASDATDPSGARVYLDAGSQTSVAGDWVDLSHDSNFVTFVVTSNELKDSADQKNGVLRGSKVTMDLRKGSSVLDLSGYQAARERTVSEKATAGGELNITSTGSLVQRQGATLDASGGGYNYGAGLSATSYLLGADGKIYDIATAPQAMRYVGVVGDYKRDFDRWGQSKTYTSSTRLVVPEAAYSQGASGGSMTLVAPSGMVLDGLLKGGVTVGPNQMANAPRAATLVIGEKGGSDKPDPKQVQDVTFASHSGDSLGAAFNVNSALSPTQQTGLTLGADSLYAAASQSSKGREENGFGSVEINANPQGKVTLPQGVRLEGSAGSALTINASEVELAGEISLPGGQFTAGVLAQVISPLDAGPLVHVADTARISTAGLWINKSNADGSYVGDAMPTGRLGADGKTVTSTTAGGSISLGGHSLQLDSGAVLDVGGGGVLDRNGRVTGGAGGSLTLVNGESSRSNPDWLRADLRGFSFTDGAKLSISTPAVVVSDDGAAGTLPANTMRVGQSFFTDNGFGSIEFKTSLGIDIATVLRPQQKNLVVDPLQARQLQTGGAVAGVTTAQVLNDDVRQATHVSFSATLPDTNPAGGRNAATVHLHEGAAIITDPKARVSIAGINGVAIDGDIVTPGGQVSITLNGSQIPPAAPALTVGQHAHISTAGTFVPTPNDKNLDLGTVIAGGTVTLDARNAGIDLKAGSVIDVSGATHAIDLPQGDGQNVSYVSTPVDGPAGTLVIKSTGTVNLDGTLQARAPSSTSAGGSFALELKGPDDALTMPQERRIVVSRSGALPAPGPEGYVDTAVSTDALAAAGFDKLRLLSENRIELREGVSVDFARGVRLDAPVLDVADGSQVSVKGANVAIGQSLGVRRSADGKFPMTNLAVLPVQPTRAGNGTLSIEGDTVDIFGSVTVNGVSRTRIEAQGDIRLTGRAVEDKDAGIIGQIGSFTSQGHLELSAAQVYPSTRTNFSIAIKDTNTGVLVPDGSVTVTGSGNTPGAVYSAAGKLTIEADTISQGGQLRAPLGEINLKAGRQLDLLSGSVTSVSTDGLVIPYGTTVAGVEWRYDDGTSAKTDAITEISADGKTVKLSGDKVNVQSGATVDLSGGGDVAAIEFVPGNGGTVDASLKDNTYAIIPKARLRSMPIDTDIAALKDAGFGFTATGSRDTALYDSLVIGSGSAVPAGEYVLLPARYALLPDAYLVQLQTTSAYRNLLLGQTTQLPNGNTVVAAFRSASGTSVRESQSIGVVVRPGSALRTEADYTVTGSRFFSDAAALDRTTPPPLPQDAGRLAIERAQELTLDGNFRTAAGTSAAGVAGGIAQIDISGQRIAVVDQAGSTAVDAGYLQLEGAALSRLNGSLLLGGTRSPSASGTTITTNATDIVVANSTSGALSVPELILSAQDHIDVRAGAVLAGTGTASSGQPQALVAEDHGALVRLSSAAQTTLDRGSVVDSSRGQVTIGAGASLGADKSVLIDATNTLRSQGTIRAGTGAGGTGGSLSLASASVSLGEVAGVPADSGLLLSNADLAAYGNLDALSLKGYNGIDFHGATQIGSGALQALTLDTGALRGHAVAGSNGTSSLRAGTVTLVNRSGTATTTAPDAAGRLEIDADQVHVGTGAKTISGWESVAMQGRQLVTAEGAGSLAVAADWTLATSKVQAAAGSNQAWTAGDGAGRFWALQLTGAQAGAPAPATSGTQVGGRLSLDGRGVQIGTTVEALSGRIAVNARGTALGDDVAVGAGGKLDARGAEKNFNGAIATANAGSVVLTTAADTGRVTVADGAVIDVSGVGRGAAGTLQVAAGEFSAGASSLVGRAGQGQRSGSAQIDVARLADGGFSAQNQALNNGGFAESRSLRVRSGHIDVAATDAVTARDVTLSADTGEVRVAGTVGGGTEERAAVIGIYGGTGVTLAAGSRINASGSAALANGGDVRVAVQSGALNFEEGATIDVRKGRDGQAGTVTLTVPRDGNNALGTHRLEGSVLSQRTATDTAATVAVEGLRVYSVGSAGTATSLTAGQIAGYAADHQSFITGTDAASVVGQIQVDGGAAVLRGATEVRTAGDLTVAQAFNVNSGVWMEGGQSGTLNLRAAGNLTVSNSVGSADNNITSGDTWNLRAVAGADLSAADALATLKAEQLAAGKGDLVLSGANAKLRTGTGRIDLAAARDVRFDDVRAVVYTAGRIGATDTETSGGNNRWGVGGGDITVRAGRNVTGALTAAGDLWITDWLRRPRTNLNAYNLAGQATDWWAYRANFQQGVGTLGGGNIDVAAGQDVTNFSAMLPTTGRTYRDDNGVRQVDVQGGGDLRVSAGNNLSGGAYLVARGQGTLDAGGNVGANRALQLYLMGESSGNVPREATVEVNAGGSVRLQNVSNPTVLSQLAVAGSTGPSFAAGGQSPFFLTYSDNSKVSLQAEGGNTTIVGATTVLGNAENVAAGLITGFRRAGATDGALSNMNSLSSLLPASLDLVSFNGDVIGQATQDVWTYPSARAEVRLLAHGSVVSPRLVVSDLDPATLPTAYTPPAILYSPNRLFSGTEVEALGTTPRILARDVEAEFPFDVQALTGSVVGDTGGNSVLRLPARSRIRAGTDVRDLRIVLQNLDESDVSEVRADEGDVRFTQSSRGLEIRGPGRLLVQAGRDVDLGPSTVSIIGSGDPVVTGGLVATGNSANPNLPSDKSARITLVAGVKDDVDLAKLDASFASFIEIAANKSKLFELFKTLGQDGDTTRVRDAASIQDLANADPRYASFVELGTKYPQLLRAYQTVLRQGSLPLGKTSEVTQADALYTALNRLTNYTAILNANTLGDLARVDGMGALQPFVTLAEKYPRLFAEFKLRLANGVTPVPVGMTSVLYADVFNAVVQEAVPTTAGAQGSIKTYQTSVQTFGGSDIDLWAPNGSAIVGLSTPAAGKTIGILTNTGGTIRSVVRDNFSINSGKVLTAQGGDIVILSSAGNIDAGRGAKTSLSTPPPKRTPIFFTPEGGGEPVVVGYAYTLPAAASGSGIQTLTSDPDGLGQLEAPKAGTPYLITPAGVVDAGEAGIRSKGNVFIDALFVKNGDNISFSGTGTGVPVAQTGSLASTLAVSGGTANTDKSAEDAARNATEAARTATASGVVKPKILTVEVMGFGDKSCKEPDCFAK